MHLKIIHVQYPKTKHILVVKRDGKCLVVYTPLKVKVKQKWYFDRGSSRYMIVNKEFLTNLQPCNLEFVTFGDGAKRTVFDSGSLKVPGMFFL